MFCKGFITLPHQAILAIVIMGKVSTFMDLTSTDSIKSIGLNWLSYHLLGPYSLTVTMRVTEQWWEEKKVLLACPACQALFSLSVLLSSYTSESRRGRLFSGGE